MIYSYMTESSWLKGH